MSGRPGWFVYVLLAASLVLNAVLLLRSNDGSSPSRGVAAPAPTAATPASAPEVAAAPVEPAAAAPAQAPAPARPSAPAGAWQVIAAAVDRTIPHAIGPHAGADGDAVSAVYARLFMWDLDLRRDLAKGDGIRVLWRKSEAGDVEVAAARLMSNKKGATLAAYRFRAPGDDYDSYWKPDGEEVPLRLKDGPLRHYEQITSLLKDRPTHKGMDFKVPVGTPVYAFKPGTVTRTNWNWSANGNAVEIRFDDGIIAKFLHLSENKVKAGDRVKAGQVVALTGNTGRTTAPHLHYQLEDGDKVVDPLDFHGTERRRLPDAAKAEFQAEMTRLDGLLDQP